MQVLWHLLTRGLTAVAHRSLLHDAARSRLALQSCGPGTEFDGTVTFHSPERISVGAYVHIEPRCQFFGRGGLKIGDHTIIASEVVVLTSTHNFVGAELQPYDQRELLRPVAIGQCVWIGFRAMILPGVRLGEGTIVGAGAIVRESCAPGSILAGNPAVRIAQRDMDHYRRCVDEGRFYLQAKQTRSLVRTDVFRRGRPPQ